MDLSLRRTELRQLFKGGLTAVTLAIGLTMIGQPPARAQGDDAMAILKAMSEYIACASLAGQGAITLQNLSRQTGEMK
jgi:hypothetical protein